MKYLKQLEGPELKMPSLHNEDVRSTGFQGQGTIMPTTQWLAMPSPDGDGSFTPFRYSKLTANPTPNRRFGNNDENPKD